MHGRGQGQTEHDMHQEHQGKQQKNTEYVWTRDMIIEM